MNFIPRSEWGAEHGSGPAVPQRPVSRVVVHHAQSPDIPAGASEAQVRRHVQAIERHHVRTNGWAAIGYNAMVDQDGRVWEGRGWGRAGAHAGNAAVNRDSVGLCFLIDGTRHEPTNAAWNAAREYIEEGVRLGELASDYRVTGHRDHRSTSCPGDRIYPHIGRLRDVSDSEATMIGRRVWSPSLGYIVVTRYESDDDWSFVRIADLQQLPGIGAGVPLSQLGEAP